MKAYLGDKFVIPGMNDEGPDAGRSAVCDVLGEVDGQDKMIADEAVLQLVRVETKREELPLVPRNLLEEVVEEGGVGPFARPAAPWQPLVGEVVADEQVCEATDGFGVGVDEGGKDAQVRPSDDAHADVKTTREGAEDARDPGCGPVFLKGA